MDCLDIGHLGGGDDPVDLEVALARGRGADADRLVGQFQVGRVLVGRRVNDGGLDAHLAASADDSQGDLAPVCDEDL
jgi:hypothetical protein